MYTYFGQLPRSGHPVEDHNRQPALSFPQSVETRALRRGEQPVANSVPNSQPNPTRNSKSLHGNELPVLISTASGSASHARCRQLAKRQRYQQIVANQTSSNPRQVLLALLIIETAGPEQKGA